MSEPIIRAVPRAETVHRSCSETGCGNLVRDDVQVSQIEKPYARQQSPDQLRRAMNLPLVPNLSSSGFQSEIQVVLRSLIADIPGSNVAMSARRSRGQKKSAVGWSARCSMPDSGVAYGPSLDLRRRTCRTRLDLRIKLVPV